MSTDLNWNKQGLVEAFFDGSNFVIKFRDDFAEMYHKDPIIIPLPDGLEIKGFETKAYLSIGAGPRPKGPQGSGNSVFVSLLVQISGGFIKAKIPLFPDAIVPLPSSQLIIRFYLHQGDVNSASLQFEPAVDRDVGFFDPPILPPIDQDVLDKLDELMQSFADRVEESLTKLNGSAHFSVLDEFVKPWLVGGLVEPGRMPFHLLRIRYEGGPDDRPDSRGIIKPATGNLVITIIGRRDDPGDIHNTQDNDGSIPLFDNIGLEEQIHVLTMEGLPLPTDPIFQRLYKIEHIVVLMQENRSFDQVLGYLRRENIELKVNGLLPDDDEGHKEQVNKFKNKEFFPQKAEVYVSKEQQEKDFPTWTRPTAWPRYSLDDPGHNADAVAEQINGGEDGGPGKMKGFVSTFARRIGEGNHSFLRQVMDYFNASDLGVYNDIRSNFGICDNWFASFAGGTLPNRFVALTGKLNRDKFGNIEEDNPDIEGGNASPIHTPTLFDYLTLHGRTWRVYVHGYGTIQLFAKYTFDITNVLMFNDREQGFEAAAEAGTLPDVTWIEPDYIELPPGNDDHAPADMFEGQVLVERIVNALMKSPNWQKTLLIITYDEHGGFYDHVTPPINDPPLGDSRRTMGPRVPAFVVSPLIRPGQVFHERFDHTTIGATILRRFCRQQPKVSERQDNAPDLSSVLELADAPLQRTDFGIFGNTKKPQLEPGSRIGPSIPSDNKTFFSFNSNAKNEDFHWFLRNISLFTGLGSDPSSFNPRSLRGWLMLNGLDASQGIRSIMSSFSVSSIKQLLAIHTEQ